MTSLPMSSAPLITGPDESSPAASADKSLLKQRAYEVLKRGIQEARFESGTFLSERQLAAQLGMSKTPIKAALERLEAEGFVSVSPQQGIVVRDLSVHEIADQFEIRLALESFVLRNLAGRLTEDQAELLRDNLRQQQRGVEQADLPSSVRLDAEFHTLFCEFFGNREVLRVMMHLRERIHRVVARVFRDNAPRLKASYQEHCVIAAAVLEGDSERAAAALEEHLEYGKQTLLSRR